MEEAKEAIKQAFKNIFSPQYRKRLIQAFIVAVFLLILLASALYYVTVDDGTYSEGDWGNTPYAASQYVNGVSINDNGTFKTDMTAQELWDQMLQNKSRVDEYLSTPAELARLMKAELLTQYPDTRSNPDEEIDWNKIKEDPDAMQGIIKFKRADTDGNKNTMSYVDPETFQGYIDTYNKTGSEEAKQNALTHFTLKKASSGTTTGGTGAIAAGDGIMTDVSQLIIDAASPDRTPWPGANWCARWVRQVYENAGVGACRHATDYEAAKHHIISTDKSAIPIGAAVYGTGSNSGGAGHVGIYIGGGKVVDSVGSGIKTWNTIEEWTAWQKDVLDGQQGWLGWGWQDNNKIRGTTEDPNLKENSTTDKKDDKEDNKKEDKEAEEKKATVAQVDGDGYTELYTSSAGITYKHFKQSKGSYAGNPYWDGTVSSDGCGPSSVAILASGVLNSEYTPGDIAAQMNATYGITSYETLKGEMDSLGMASEVIQSPSAEVIQDNLRNGKVMLVSVNSNTIFTSISHIMAIVDINEQGQVYICNPGSSSLQGWYDIGEIMKGCQYVVVTDAGAAGVAKSKNTNNYVAVVATWSQKDTSIESNDPNVGNNAYTEYSMTTTSVNYEEMVAPYTMPFDMLWALLVVGEDKNFAFELADLIYDSEIEITVHDNLTVNTDIDEWHYTQRTKAEVSGMITARTNQNAVSGHITEHSYDPHSEDPYTTTKTVITQTNTLNVVLTKADVWIVKYNNEYTYVAASETTTTNTVTKGNEEYPDMPSYTGDSYSCDHITTLRQNLLDELLPETEEGEAEEPQSPVRFTENINVNYYTKYINIYDNVTNKTRTQKYVQGVPEFEEKIEPKSEEPNFVTIFNKQEYRKNKINIKDAAECLFEIIETNDSIKDMLDLIKYLLYKATGNVFDGIEYFDFSIFYPGGLSTVGEGDYIVHIDKSSPDIVITDVETLKRAFAGYTGGGKLVEHAQEYLDLQEEYRVNAVFAAAVSISETSAGRAGHAIDGKNNWYNIECIHNKAHGRFENYGSARESIEAFFKQISVKNYYFTAGKFTVSEIGMVYCENADAPGGWIEHTTTFMTQMFNAAGITPTTSGTSQTGTKIVEAAKTKLGCPYVWGAEGPVTFDCSGLTKWAYKQVGIDLPHNTDSQKNAATKVVSISEARVGDILYRKGHVGIYIGNDQYIHAPQTGDVVKIANGANYFTHALQFY